MSGTTQCMVNGDSRMADAIGARAAKVLMTKFPIEPPHLWMVDVKDGAIWLKSSMTGKAGMIRHLAKIDFSSSEFERQIEFAAAELLERARLSRTATEMDYAQTLDGGESFKWKPVLRIGK